MFFSYNPVFSCLLRLFHTFLLQCTHRYARIPSCSHGTGARRKLHRFCFFQARRTAQLTREPLQELQ